MILSSFKSIQTKVAFLASILLLQSRNPLHAADEPIASPKASHIIVIIMDGLRPDTITPTDMPNLYQLKQQGTFFSRHHPVYLSSTEVNGTAIATGDYPKHSGLIANTEFRPNIDPLKASGTQDQKFVEKGDAVTHGHYLKVPTLAEILEKSGKTSIVAGTKPVALLLLRAPKPETNSNGQTLFEGKILLAPKDASASTNEQFPIKAYPTLAPNQAQDAWTTRMLITRLWANQLPTLTMLWLSEPDYAQHGSGPGSPIARAALKSSDKNLGLLLADLDRRHLRDSTDLFIISDHGFSTIRCHIDLLQLLQSQHFNALKELPKSLIGNEALTIENGGSECLYIPSHNPQIIRNLVRYLQTTDYAGVIFMRNPLPGTFGLDQGRIDSPDAPDILFSFQWDSQKSATGLPGRIDADGTKYFAGQGNHSTLSPFDMHNTLIAIGPDFRSSFIDTLPTGNVDLTPTILSLLQIKPPAQLDGRVLTEALTLPNSPTPQSTSETLHADLDDGPLHWHQYLKTSTVNNVTYFDEGNSLPAAP